MKKKVINKNLIIDFSEISFYFYFLKNIGMSFGVVFFISLIGYTIYIKDGLCAF